jgi:hypothetical protein
MFRPRQLTLAVIVVVAACALTVAVPAFSAKKPAARIPVFVRSSADSDGFTDPSKTMILKMMRNSKVVASVDTPEAAVILLEVVSNETTPLDPVRAKVYGSTMTFDQSQTVITVRMMVGSYTTTFTGKTDPYHMWAHRVVVEQFEAWVLANRARLAPLVEAESAR